MKNIGRFRSQRGCGRGRGHGRGEKEHVHAYGGRGNSNNALNNEEKSFSSIRAHGRARGRGRGYSQNERRYEKSKVECYICHKLSHFSWECRLNEMEEKANLINEEESTLLLTLKGEDKDVNCSWYLDNGANNHMCGYKEKFVELNENVSGNVSLGNSSKVRIEGKGTILISSKDGSHKMINDVYYVPKLKSNILNLGQLLEKGYEILMKDKCLWLKDQNENLIAKVLMSRNRIFILNLKTIEAKCLKVIVQDKVWCWHMRFGHLNFTTCSCREQIR